MTISSQYTSPTLDKKQFFGYWRWVHIRTCKNCGKDVRILGGDTRRPPNLPPGGIRCPHCQIRLVGF